MPFSVDRKTQLALRATTTRKYGSFASKNADQFLGLSSIATAEAFGTATLSVTARPTFGGKTRLALGGFTQPRHGTLTAHTGNISPSSIDSLETIGSHVIIGGTVVIAPSAIASLEAFGTATMVRENTISPSAIDTATAFGTTVIAPAGTLVVPAIGDSQKLAEWTMNEEGDLAGYRVYVSRTSMTFTIGPGTAVYDVGLTSTPSTPSYVIAGLTSGTTYYVAVTAYDTSNNESAFSTEASFVASGSNRFGDINVIGNRNIDLTGLAGAEAFGSHQLAPGSVSILPLSKTSDEAFGAHFVLAGEFAIGGIGIDSAEAFGDITTEIGAIVIDLDSPIASEESVSAPELFFTYLIENVGALPSLEAFGTPLIDTGGDQTVRLIAVDSTFEAGTLQLDQDITIPEIASAETFGDLATNVDMFLEGIASAESIGAHEVIPAPVDIFPPSIATQEGFGTSILIPGELQLPVRVFPARSRTFLFPSAARR